MAQRRIIHDSDDDLGDEESQFLPKKYNKSSKDGYELMRLRDVQRFISKIYWLIILAFVCIGIAMAVVLNEGTFKDVFMAESSSPRSGSPCMFSWWPCSSCATPIKR